jgi:hypothetical protein
MLKRLIAIILFVCCGLPSFCAINAVFREVTGKVEVNDGKGWKQAKVGATISKGATVSTGFKSKATLDMGPSVLYVRPLTRMKLEELIEKEGTIQAELFLDVGRITAEVNTAKGVAQDFKLKSPISTAAVRGTIVDFWDIRIKLVRGSATAYNGLGQPIQLREGDDILFGGQYDRPRGSKERDRDFSVNPYTFGADVGNIGGKPAPTKIVVILRW